MENSQSIEKPTAVITFDDGYAGNKNIVLPIIKSTNVPVTIFVSTGAVQDQTLYWYDRLIIALQGYKATTISLKHPSMGSYHINRSKGSRNWVEIQRLLTDLKTLEPSLREKTVKDILVDVSSTKKVHSYAMAPLTIGDLRELAACSLITIGAHSHCHNILTQLSKDGIRNSIQKSKNLLESWINRTVSYFSYPNGDYNDTVINILKETEFTCGMTTNSKPWGTNASYFTIPRIGIGRYDSLNYFKVKVSGIA
jgi:peptidoglycan/xylan/chitin deacetylase (PgdA/CDA1 family)